MLVFAFQSEIWIAQNLNFTVLKDFCLSLSWKYRFSQNVNHTKVQSKTNKYCKFHVDLTRRRLCKSRLKKLGMVPKKLYRNTLKLFFFVSVNFATGKKKKVQNDPGRTRTCNLLIRSQTPYPLGHEAEHRLLVNVCKIYSILSFFIPNRNTDKS